jgi:hypothetical protein
MTEDTELEQLIYLRAYAAARLFRLTAEESFHS